MHFLHLWYLEHPVVPRLHSWERLHNMCILLRQVVVLIDLTHSTQISNRWLVSYMRKPYMSALLLGLLKSLRIT